MVLQTKTRYPTVRASPRGLVVRVPHAEGAASAVGDEPRLRKDLADGTVIRAIVMAGPDIANAIISVMVTIAATIFVPIGLLQQAVRLARIESGELDSCLVTKRCSAIGLGHRCCR